MARTNWNDCFNWARRYPVLASRADTIKHLTIERMLWLYELKELQTGAKARMRAWRHRKAVWAARRARAAAWQEDCAYE